MTESTCFSENLIEIDLSALGNNYRVAQDLILPEQRIMAIVKSDGYGHGMIPISRELERLGCSFFGVFNLEEGIRLREAGIKSPIVVMKGIDPADCRHYLDFNLIPVLYNLDVARRLHQEARNKGVTARVHLKFDTGMGRLGVLYEHSSQFLTEIQKLTALEVDGFMTHLAMAGQNTHTRLQLERFDKLCSMAKAMGFHLRNSHVCNSSALVSGVNSDAHMVRVGLLLYGLVPPPKTKSEAPELKPLMRFSSRIVQLKEVPGEYGISYGRTYITNGPRTIATIPVGYNNGYSRLMSNSAQVLVRGKRVPVVGSVCMNLTMLDITDSPQAAVGDEVVLLGNQGDEEITVDELAEWSHTISYEILCSLGSRNRRSYVNG